MGTHWRRVRVRAQPSAGRKVHELGGSSGRGGRPAPRRPDAPTATRRKLWGQPPGVCGCRGHTPRGPIWMAEERGQRPPARGGRGLQHAIVPGGQTPPRVTKHKGSGVWKGGARPGHGPPSTGASRRLGLWLWGIRHSVAGQRQPPPRAVKSQQHLLSRSKVPPRRAAALRSVPWH